MCCWIWIWPCADGCSCPEQEALTRNLPATLEAASLQPVQRHPASNRLVIGIGNPLRGDDGVGALLAEQAAVQTAARCVQQLTPELAAELAHLDAVLFIDAWEAVAGTEPQLQDLQPAGASGDSHRLEPAALLAVCQALYGRAPAAQLLLVPASAFAHGTALSTRLQQALPAARTLLHQWLHGHA
ncbi:MAG: hydrogenase maturation protease [Cyanobacteria bacterium K_DeepCast_35m_m2_023]|nr:hydrogenase maturation protease [Cyanobacteria bacterium K_DeepCast_35m_m2_023]